MLSNYQKNIKNIRRNILKMSHLTKAGHIPSALSMVDYLYILFKSNFIDITEDKVLIGKPYGSQAYYAVFADMGLIEEEDLWTFGEDDSLLTYGVTAKFPGIDFAEDTLASCLGVACGMALSFKNRSIDKKVYINVSDASLQAGTVWEGVMFASANNLNNMVLTVDYNKQQILCETFGLERIEEMFRSFNWQVYRCDGHDPKQILKAYKHYFSRVPSKPTVFIFDTIKGKGVSFMESDLKWHYKYLTDEDYNNACLEVL